MKKTFLALTLIALATSGSFAQKKLQRAENLEAKAVNVKSTSDAKTSGIQFVNGETHDFGLLQEGDPAEAEFVFKNTGKEPLIIQNVHPSCGCTVPSWPKEAIAPGKTAVIKAAYGTRGRVGSFNKSISVTSTAGSNTLWIKGNVEKAPEGSAPANTSMIKTR